MRTISVPCSQTILHRDKSCTTENSRPKLYLVTAEQIPRHHGVSDSTPSQQSDQDRLNFALKTAPACASHTIWVISPKGKGIMLVGFRIVFYSIRQLLGNGSAALRIFLLPTILTFAFINYFQLNCIFSGPAIDQAIRGGNFPWLATTALFVFSELLFL